MALDMIQLFLDEYQHLNNQARRRTVFHKFHNGIEGRLTKVFDLVP